jgi:hypothetical protein
MPYVTLFEISQQSFDWWFPAAGLLFLAIGIVLVKFIAKREGHENAKLIGWCMIVFASLWTLIAIAGTYSAYSEFLGAYKTGDYSVVEGTVQDFHPMPYSGHSEECFRVEDKRFCYSDYAIDPGFRQTASHGGPVRAGLPVRIAYYEGRILRLEMRADSVPSMTERLAYAKDEENKWRERDRTDPEIDRMTLGFAFAGLVISLCWTLDWRHYIRYWIRRGPPFNRYLELGFRAFFGACLLGSGISLIQQILRKPRSLTDFEQAALRSLFWIGFFVIADLLFRRQLRARSQSSGDPPLSAP